MMTKMNFFFSELCVSFVFHFFQHQRNIHGLVKHMMIAGNIRRENWRYWRYEYEAHEARGALKGGKRRKAHKGM